MYEFLIRPMNGWANTPDLVIMPTGGQTAELMTKGTAMYDLDGTKIGNAEAEHVSFFGVTTWEVFDHRGAWDLTLTSFTLILEPERRVRSQGAMSFEYEGVRYGGGWSSRCGVFNTLGVRQPLIEATLSSVHKGAPSGGLAVNVPVPLARKAGVRINYEPRDGEERYVVEDTYKTPGLDSRDVLFRKPDYRYRGKEFCAHCGLEILPAMPADDRGGLPMHEACAPVSVSMADSREMVRKAYADLLRLEGDERG